MARSDEDIINITFEVSAQISLDIERIINDPIWKILCLSEGYDDTSYYPELLQLYISYYVVRDKFLSHMPSTNGPAECNIIIKDFSNDK